MTLEEQKEFLNKMEDREEKIQIASALLAGILSNPYKNALNMEKCVAEAIEGAEALIKKINGND